MNKRTELHFFYLSYLVICSVIFFVFSPYIFTAPRSEFWAAAYFFSRLDGLFKLDTLKQLSSYYLDGQPRFQPLSHIFLYVIMNFFQSRIVFYNLLNLFLYFILILVLYKLSLFITENAWIRFLAIGTFSILLTHFDIVCWPYHYYITLGAIFLFTALYLLIHYSETPCLFFFLSFSLCLLLGLLCYEPFFIWPIVFLFAIKYKPSTRTVVLGTIACIVVVYLIYFCIFSKITSFSVLNAAYSQPLYSLNTLKTAFILILKNLFFINILSNLFPFLVTPLGMNGNVELQGFLFTHSLFNRNSLLIFMIFVTSTVLWISLRKRKICNPFLTITLSLMYFSFCFLLFFGRLLTDSEDCALAQPRYHFISNILITLLLLSFVDTIYRKASKLLKVLVVLIFIYVFVINIFYTRESVKEAALESQPLTTLLGNIQRAIDEKIITEKLPLFIPEDIVYYMPALCWYENINYFIKEGRYEYIFRDKLHLFRFSPDGAKYSVDKNTLKIIPIKN